MHREFWMKHQIHYREEFHLFHKWERICYNEMRDLYRNDQRQMSYSREPSVSTCHEQQKSHTSVEGDHWDHKKDGAVNIWTMSLHTWKRRETSAKGTKVPAADPCISKRTQQRLVGRWRWGEKVKKSAQEQLPAILSHHSTRQWRKWTWQSGGWWQESSLGVYILQVYKKIARGWSKGWWCGTGYSWHQK